MKPSRRIVTDWRTYAADGHWRPADKKLWYVVLDAELLCGSAYKSEGEHEVTRDLKRDVAELYLKESP
jgi:hypothetical protein